MIGNPKAFITSPERLKAAQRALGAALDRYLVRNPEVRTAEAGEAAS